MAEICGANLDSILARHASLHNIRVQLTFASRSIQRDLYISRESCFRQAQHEAYVQKHPTLSPHFKTRQESHLQKMRFTSSKDEIYIFKKTKSDTRVFINKSRVFSFQHRSMSLLLQSAQQYTSKGN